jgi:hypothetical protein
MANSATRFCLMATRARASGLSNIVVFLLVACIAPLAVGTTRALNPKGARTTSVAPATSLIARTIVLAEPKCFRRTRRADRSSAYKNLHPLQILARSYAREKLRRVISWTFGLINRRHGTRAFENCPWRMACALHQAKAICGYERINDSTNRSCTSIVEIS